MGRWASMVVGMTWLLGMGHAMGYAATTKPTTRGASLFEPGRVWTVQLKLSAKSWEMMQPTRGSRLAFLLGVSRDELPTTQPSTRPATRMVASTGPSGKKEEVEGKRMPPVAAGLEYAYVKATVELEGEAVKDVGLRFKGNGSYLSSAWLRRPMKISFDKFVDGQTFRGLSELNLHNSAVDPSYLREVLGFEVYREAGIPSPRVAFALVYLTVEGQFDRQYIGLYDLVEDIEKEFLKEHFGNGKGLLLKPDGVRNLAYLGEDWADYLRYRAKEDGTAELRKRFVEFTRFVHYADDEMFVGAVRSYVNMDLFLRFLAVITLESDMDSFLTAGHNFYMYVHPDNGRVHFMPWDMHLAFGGTSSDQNPAPAVNLSIRKPFPGSNRLIERVLMIEAYRVQYEDYLREFSTGCFSPPRMHARVDELQKVVKLAEEVERIGAVVGGATTRPTTMPARPLRSMPELKMYVTRRVESVLGQLAGTIEGQAPGESPPGPPPPPPPPPRMINPPPPRPVRKVEPRAVRADAKVAGGALRRAVVDATQTRVAVTTRPSVATTQPSLTTTRRAPVTQPALVMRPERSARERPIVTRRSIRRAEAGVPLVLRTIDTDRTNTLTVAEMILAVRVFYHATHGANGAGLDEPAIARGLDRMGELLDSSRVAPLGDGPTAASEPSVEWAKAMVKRADANADGRVTLMEAVGAMGKWFADADADHDGVLTQRELSDAMDQLIQP